MSTEARPRAASARPPTPAPTYRKALHHALRHHARRHVPGLRAARSRECSPQPQRAAGEDPMILTLARGHYCPKEHQQHLELAANYPKINVAYTKVVTISTDDHHASQEFRN